MKCPFCQEDLSLYSYKDMMHYFCDNNQCLIVSDINRYHACVDINNQIVNETYYLDPYYVHADCINQKTIISILDVIILLNSIIISKSILLDKNNTNNTLEKIKKLSLFS